MDVIFHKYIFLLRGSNPGISLRLPPSYIENFWTKKIYQEKPLQMKSYTDTGTLNLPKSPESGVCIMISLDTLQASMAKRRFPNHFKSQKDQQNPTIDLECRDCFGMQNCFKFQSNFGYRRKIFTAKIVQEREI